MLSPKTPHTVSLTVNLAFTPTSGAALMWPKTLNPVILTSIFLLTRTSGAALRGTEPGTNRLLSWHWHVARPTMSSQLLAPSGCALMCRGAHGVPMLGRSVVVLSSHSVSPSAAIIMVRVAPLVRGQVNSQSKTPYAVAEDSLTRRSGL